MTTTVETVVGAFVGVGAGVVADFVAGVVAGGFEATDVADETATGPLPPDHFERTRMLAKVSTN